MKTPSKAWRRAVASIVAFSMMFSQIAPSAYAGSTDISDIPLAVKNRVAPNIMMTLDDSGSMQWEFLPEEQMRWSLYMYPPPASLYLGGVYSDQVPNFKDNNVHNFYGRSANNNKLYYNPNITYEPWVKADGSEWPQADPRAAYYNPANTAAGTIDLTRQKTETAIWFSSTNRSTANCDPCGGNQTYWPITYFNYNGGNVESRASYTKVEIKNTDPASNTYSYRKPDGTIATRNKAEEVQNFANWFVYYRSRISAARAGVGRAFSMLSETPRVGFASINTGARTIDGVSSPGTILTGVRPFTGSSRTNFYSSLYNLPINIAGTPLRQALDDVGKYFSRTDASGPWGANPGTGGGSQLACRQNYVIMTTDGYWNASPARTSGARANVDNTTGATHTSVPDPVTGATRTYTYTPANPKKDSWSDTLADVAMYYWVRDLRPDLANNVFTNTVDNAFWQHMTTYGVALGVFGTIPKASIDAAFTTSPVTINWPNPNSSDQAKIDDLAHAGVNGRGGFFSSSDPVEFATSLAGTLESVGARTTAEAAVAVTNPTIVAGDNIMFASSYLPGFTWSGELAAYTIDADTGIPGTTPIWTAQAQLDQRTPDSRLIASYSGNSGTGQGVRFKVQPTPGPRDLSNAQMSLLATPGVTPPDGKNVVNYLRGDRTGENDGTYRKRTHLLGDIVDQQALVIRPPMQRYVDSGYSAFKTAQATRRQIVLQGANDGMLHAFDAGTAPNGTTPGTAGTGAELWAYFPTFLLSTMNSITRAVGYAHKYGVDATPVTGDADFNKTNGATGSPDWRTMVAGGVGKGGRGYYALDVTSTTATTDLEVADKVLWEFPNNSTLATVKANVGYTFGRPIITKTRAAGWVVLVTSGYNNGTDTGGDGKGYLFVLNAKTGALIQAISTNVGSSTDPSGLAHIAGFAMNAALDNTVEYVYGGDLKGNVWRFDLSGATTTAWNVSKLATLVDGSGNFQPVTAEPELSRIKLDTGYKRFVYVGTGLLLGDGDIPGVTGANAHASQTQTMYALIDNESATPLISPLRSNLQQQTFTTLADGTGNRKASSNTVDWTVKKGWYIDLPQTGERVNTAPALVIGALVFTTNVPSSDPCVLGGTSYINFLDYTTGGYRTIDSTMPSSIRYAQGLASGVAVASISGDRVITPIRLSDGSTVVPPPLRSGSASSVTKRRSWRELLQ